MLPFASLHRTQRRRPFGFTLIELLLVGVMLLVGTLLWALFGSSHNPNHDTNAVVAQSERALAELLTWVLPVRAALAETGAAVGPAEPGTWPAGSGVELPAYLVTVEVGLL